jgi:hypothetical protein
MLQITGSENIMLPHVKQIVVSNIVPLEIPDTEWPYQRELVIVTDEGMLRITLIAKERATLTFAEG